MLAGRAWRAAPAICRPYATSGKQLRPIPILPDASIETFKRDAFDPANPALLPRGHFADLPAVQKWFLVSSEAGEETPRIALNRTYLSRFGATRVPLEISNADHFTRIEQSLSFFLACVHAASSNYAADPPPRARYRYFTTYLPGASSAIRRSTQRTRRPAEDNFFTSSRVAAAAPLAPPTARVYLAQCPLEDLPRPLRADVPVPALVHRSGKGDVYASALWLGDAPTYSPLHRDPNPNLFVQLAGRKVVRLLRPEVGRGVFAAVQERIQGNAAERLRGEEMMMGEEKKVLEEEIWGTRGADDDDDRGVVMWEAELHSGDGLFIPKGWWHSVKGVGEGMTGSVNWWFR